MGLSGFGPESPTPEAGRMPGYPTNPRLLIDLLYKKLFFNFFPDEFSYRNRLCIT
jgi:hypothetical protein